VLGPGPGSSRQAVVAHQLVDRLDALLEELVGVSLVLRLELLGERVGLGSDLPGLLLSLIRVREAILERLEAIVDRPVMLDLALGRAPQSRRRVRRRAWVRGRAASDHALGADEVDRVAHQRKSCKLGAGWPRGERRLDRLVALEHGLIVELADLVDR